MSLWHVCFYLLYGDYENEAYQQSVAANDNCWVVLEINYTKLNSWIESSFSTSTHDKWKSSDCPIWYRSLFEVSKNILFSISLVTFKVSSCTIFPIFWGPAWTMLGDLTVFLQIPSWSGQGGLLPLSPRTLPRPPALGSSGFSALRASAQISPLCYLHPYCGTQLHMLTSGLNLACKFLKVILLPVV